MQKNNVRIRRVFLLNKEGKILIFLSLGNGIPKIIIPSLDMPFMYMNLSLNLKEYEYVASYTTQQERLKETNGHLEKQYLISQNMYYTKTFDLTDKIQEDILTFCEENYFMVDFLSVEEIEEALVYIKMSYENIIQDKKLEKSIYILKRKLNYEEH